MSDILADPQARLALWRRVEWAARRAGIDGLNALGDFCRAHAITLTDPATTDELEHLIHTLNKNRKPKNQNQP